MSYPKIDIELSGFSTCRLLGKAKIVTHFKRDNRVFFVVEATTPVEEQHKTKELFELRVKVTIYPESERYSEGYLVYFGTMVEGYFELLPLDDERFKKYEEELQKQIEEV